MFPTLSTLGFVLVACRGGDEQLADLQALVADLQGTVAELNAADAAAGAVDAAHDEALNSLAAELAAVTEGIDLTDLADQVDANGSDIAANTTSIVGNTATALDNASGITANASGITANASGITANASGITANASGITANAAGITANAGSIADNAVSIGANTVATTANTEDLDGRVVFWTAVIGGTSTTNVVKYTLPDGTVYTLDGSAATSGDIVYDADGMLVLDLTGTHAQLLVNIEDAGSVACALFHNEDDYVRDRKTASDLGNGYVTEWSAAGYSCSGTDCPDTFLIENRDGGDHAIFDNENYLLVCVE
jgi:hypothetical protein